MLRQNLEGKQKGEKVSFYGGYLQRIRPCVVLPELCDHGNQQHSSGCGFAEALKWWHQYSVSVGRLNGEEAELVLS